MGHVFAGDVFQSVEIGNMLLVIVSHAKPQLVSVIGKLIVFSTNLRNTTFYVWKDQLRFGSNQNENLA